MKLTANITLDELTKSQVAERKGINNNPSPEQIENLKALAVNVLQPIRSHYDKPLIISSGFRCAQLCVEIGSSINSQHVADGDDRESCQLPARSGPCRCNDDEHRDGPGKPVQRLSDKSHSVKSFHALLIWLMNAFRFW